MNGPYKGSLAWAAARQSPSYLISYLAVGSSILTECSRRDGHGKLPFKSKVIVNDDSAPHVFTSGPIYRISLEEFDLVREIGRGQYGMVLLVNHLSLDKLMALKVAFVLARTNSRE